MLQFLAPLFLVALAGLAIPVVLHLTQREKKQIIRFPSLMFVRRIPYQSVRRRKIHNWLLLFVRMAALALLIAAFARPLIPRASPLVVPGGGAREVVVLLDTSYSMGYSDRWERARRAAREAVSDLSVSDRGSVVLFSSSSEISARSVERDKAVAAVDSAKLSVGATRYAPALKVAGSILSDTKLPRREVVLISDFQMVGWRGEEGARLPTGTKLTTVPVGGPVDRPNAGITSVALARQVANNQERVEVTAGVVNRSSRPVENLAVRLEMGNIPHGTQTVSLPAGASSTVKFEAFNINSRNMRGVLRIGDDALATDNAYYFVVSPAQPLRVTVLDRGTTESRRYIVDALAAGDSPKFDTVVRQPEAVSDDELRRSAVVVLNDVGIASNVARRLDRYVTEGGGLLVSAGTRATWPAEVMTLPGSLGNPVDRRTGEPARISVLEYGHPVFEQFRGPRNGNFSSAKVFSYRSISPTKDSQLLARFDGGAPAALERRVGNGRVLLWASAFDRDASDLPIRGIFPVLVRQSVLYLASYRAEQASATVGQVLDPSVAAAPKGAPSVARVVLTPSGRRVPLQDEEADVLELSEQGFYEVRGAVGSEPSVIASNVDPAESDLTPLDPKDITVAAVGDPGASDPSSGRTEPLTPEAQENNQRLWQYLLFAGVLLLGLDTVLSNRLTAKG
ncbi:MAG TPA: BatA domain-containing protein [Vicinamibacterales bacterium]|nr:BatA domain-containing protein [Vicinamibacterales bacterium]